jgi:hypothetical protein
LIQLNRKLHGALIFPYLKTNADITFTDELIKTKEVAKDIERENQQLRIENLLLKREATREIMNFTV